MKKFLVCTLVLCQLVCACTYHGQIRRGIYKQKDFKDKINARVMVVSDKYFPSNYTIDAEDRYIYRLTDGLPVAVADALGTLFTEVEVNQYQYRKEYDFIVEIDYHVQAYMEVKRYVRQGAIFPRYYADPKMKSTLLLTVRNPKTGYAVARYSATQETMLNSARTNGLLWVTGLLRGLTFGILSPIDIQVFGGKLGKQLEKDIADSLSAQIMPHMQEDRINFTQTFAQQAPVRVDGKFLPFLKATVYIHTDTNVGSGFLIDPLGYIVTNAHVVGKNRDVGVLLYDEQALLDKTDPTQIVMAQTIGNKVRFAKVLKVNKQRDLALLKIEGEKYPYLTLETDRSTYVTGKQVAALGAPRGIEWSVTEGIISAVRDNNGVDTIQTDSAINNGNSGGPLVDLTTGKVVGVNSWKLIADEDLHSLRQGIQGLNFAISGFEVARTLAVTQPVHEDDFID